MNTDHEAERDAIATSQMLCIVIISAGALACAAMIGIACFAACHKKSSSLTPLGPESRAQGFVDELNIINHHQTQIRQAGFKSAAVIEGGASLRRSAGTLEGQSRAGQPLIAPPSDLSRSTNLSVPVQGIETGANVASLSRQLAINAARCTSESRNLRGRNMEKRADGQTLLADAIRLRMEDDASHTARAEAAKTSAAGNIRQRAVNFSPIASGGAVPMSGRSMPSVPSGEDSTI